MNPGKIIIMENRQKDKLLLFYRDHLYNTILPFWLNKAIDYEDGGYYTCFDNSGEHLISTDKYVWPQGRFIWVLSKLAEIDPDNTEYLDIAKLGVDFLNKHCFLPNGNCAFVLTKKGELKEAIPGSGYEISFYVDCFVTMGFAKYAGMTHDQRILEKAVTLYESVIRRISNKTFKSEPYPIPKGYKAHAVPMIALNVGQVLIEALGVFRDNRIHAIKKQCSSFVAEIMDNFVHGKLLLEMIGEDNTPVNSILGSYVNPGHTIEDMWFIMHYAQEANDQVLIEQTVELAKEAFDLGWDETYGGLFQYIHMKGGKPVGNKEGLENSVMVKKLETDWDNKLWWPHSEALYTFLLGYYLTEDPSLLAYHQRAFEYTFKTFPNTNKEIGEWINIRDRQGNPCSKVVALPIKDPYHIARNLILIIELLSKM